MCDLLLVSECLRKGFLPYPAPIFVCRVDQESEASCCSLFVTSTEELATRPDVQLLSWAKLLARKEIATLRRMTCLTRLQES